MAILFESPGLLAYTEWLRAIEQPVNYGLTQSELNRVKLNRLEFERTGSALSSVIVNVPHASFAA
jgi:hypothetical protein